MTRGSLVSSSLVNMTGELFRYAGWLGTIAAKYKENGMLTDVIPSVDESRHRLAAVAGTSTCHIVQVSMNCSVIYKQPPDVVISEP